MISKKNMNTLNEISLKNLLLTKKRKKKKLPINKITTFFTLFFVAFSFAKTDSLEVNEIDSLIVEQHFISLDSIHSSFKNSGIYNAETLDIFFQKLQDLETNQNRKVNIVHIGDSHIQAD